MTTLSEGGCALIEPSRLTVPLGARTHPPGGCCANGTIISGIDMRSGRRPALPADKGSRGLGLGYPGWERRWERVPLESALGRSRPLARARRVTWAGCIPAGCRLPNTFLGIKGSPAQIRPSPLVVKFFRIFPDEAPLSLGRSCRSLAVMPL